MARETQTVADDVAVAGKPLGDASASKSRWAMWASAFLCCTVFLACNFRMFTGGALAAGGDGLRFFLPYYVLVADHARAGRLLTWDPWSSAGLPAFADPQVGAASPVTVLCALATGGTVQGWGIYTGLMWLLGGLGIFALGRQLRSPVWGCFVVAMGWLGCGFYLSQLMHTAHVVSFSFLPWVIWRFDAALQRRSWVVTLQAAAPLGLAGLGGYPGLTVTTAMFCVVWAVGRIVLGDEYPLLTSHRERTAPGTRGGTGTRGFAWGSAGRAAVGVALFLVVSGAILLPSYGGFLYEGRGITTRSREVTWEEVMRSPALDPAAMLTVGSPQLSKALPKDAQNIRTRAAMTRNLYCGVGVLLLTVVALCSARGRPWRWYLVGVGALATLIAMGPAVPLRHWMLEWVPLMGVFRQSAFYRNYVFFSVAVLALLGARDLAVGTSRERWRVVCVVAGTLTVAAVAGYTFVLWRCWSACTWPGLGLLHVAIWPGMAVLVLGIYRTHGWLRGVLVLGAMLMASADFGIAVGLWDDATLNQTNDAAQQVVRSLSAQHATSISLGEEGFKRHSEYSDGDEHLFAKRPVLGSYTAFRSPFLPFVLATPAEKQAAMATFGFAAGGERTWFAEAAVPCPPDVGAYAAFAARGNGGNKPLLLHSRERMLQIGGDLGGAAFGGAIADAVAMRPIEARVREYSPLSLSLDVVAPSAGWVLVTERWSRSWVARVDGVEAPVLGGNFLYRAVHVGEGRHVIEMRYDLRWFYACVGLSWGLLVAIGGVSWWREKRSEVRGQRSERSEDGGERKLSLPPDI